MRIVITGGPCSGKTTLLGALAERGFVTVPEAAILVIDELNAALGVAEQKQWRRNNLEAFQELVLSKQLELEARAVATGNAGSALAFFDRGQLDGLAYCRHFDKSPPARLVSAANDTRYDRVFLLETLRDFVDRSAEGRTSDYATSVALGRALDVTYREYGYEPVPVACGTVADRVRFVLQRLGHP